MDSLSKPERCFSQCEIRLAEARDITQIVSIEGRVNPCPWSESALIESLDAEQEFYVLCGVQAKPLAYMIASCVLDEASILHLAVDDEYQGKGYATYMLGWWLARLDQPDSKVATCWLEVREFNQIARRLYESLGFEYHSRRKGYYRPPVAEEGAKREDAIVYFRRKRVTALNHTANADRS